MTSLQGPAPRSRGSVATRRFRWLILPIETKVRELDGKLLLAATAAERGWAVILGHKDTLAAETADIRGIVLEKDGHIANNRITSYLETGKLVCAMDEEGLVYLNGEDYYRRRLSAGSLQRLALFCLWGANQRRDILQHIPGIENRLVLTGSPRFDLLRAGLRNYYSPEARRLRDRLGPFLLVNTNFADSNHFMGTEWAIEAHRRSGFITTAQQEADERAFIAYQAGILEQFMDLARELCLRYRDHQVIIRPHPSEDHRKWSAVAQPLRNMKVMHEGDVNPWLLAADLAIHNSCMTGIHGFLLETPTIAYMPVRSDRFDLFLPNVLSTETDTSGELFEVADRVIGGSKVADPARKRNQMAIAEQFITAIDGPLAAERIMEALESLAVEPDTYKARRVPRNERPHSRTAAEGPVGGLDTIARRFAAVPRSAIMAVSERKHRAYSKQKYPGMTMAEIEAKISALRAASPRVGPLHVWQHGDQSFVIMAQSAAG